MVHKAVEADSKLAVDNDESCDLMLGMKVYDHTLHFCQLFVRYSTM